MYSLPFLFKNEQHFWWFLAQPQAAELAQQLESKGIKIIGYMDSGSRNFFTSKAVRTPDDLKGQKIRVMASPVMVNTMKALGATGVPFFVVDEKYGVSGAQPAELLIEVLQRAYDEGANPSTTAAATTA